MNPYLLPLYRWFMGNPERYAKYLTNTQWFHTLKFDERYDFLMLVWYSEGCPEI